MKRIPVFILAAVVFGFGVECHVDCPKGFGAACVKVDEGCYCSCVANTKDAKQEIVQSLQRLDASSQVLQQAKALLQGRDELSATTLTDERTKKNYTISLTPPEKDKQ